MFSEPLLHVGSTLGTCGGNAGAQTGGAIERSERVTRSRSEGDSRACTRAQRPSRAAAESGSTPPSCK